MNAETQLAIAVAHEKAASLWEQAAYEADMEGDAATAILRMEAADHNRRAAQDVLPADRWEVRRGNELLHVATTRNEAEARGQELIRKETETPDVDIRWVCLGCEYEDIECPTCEQGPPKYLTARGALTSLTYSIDRYTTA
ncbi:hypothetical protein GCM10010293_40620 [Streptomyces griseoflavus]|uniref:hypothetical protein n=1 Tax=Streptomyces griseoflavus TaxID=35619 RepID=UPI00167C700E|nr:hypothetical protein [Streptomyces griseoflavus]GGV36992.1 hypothetical protein GCM10010293_40620 [Streptomyces griseoflavus]